MGRSSGRVVSRRSFRPGPLDLLVGERLGQLRSARGLSLNQLAKRADLTHSTLSVIERGKATPLVATVERIAVALRVTPRDLLTVSLVDDDLDVIYDAMGKSNDDLATVRQFVTDVNTERFALTSVGA